MDPNRRQWNDQQQQLQKALGRMEDPSKVVALFLDHHAMVHSAQMAGGGLWSFEDEVLQGLEEADFRKIPDNEDHSVAWVLWHLARIEDVTMNTLVGGKPQVFWEENWRTSLNFNSCETGNAMDSSEIRILSASINVEALKAYRVSVGRRTREIVKILKPVEFKQKMNPTCLENIMAEGTVVESTRWLIDYWGKKTIAGLLLMPPTRHNYVHLNEIARFKRKILAN